MTTWPRPTPEHQLEFLRRIQSLFDDGDFSATYKFALLMSLAELAVERGTDDGRPLDLDLIQIGEKFAELYWPQTIPYSSGASGASVDILAQNQGAQAAVINELLKLRSSGVNTLSQAKQLRQWPDTARRITRVVRQMPVQFLQNIGGTTVPFLYDFPPPIGKLVLKPGVAFLLRSFHGLIQQLARTAWITHIRHNNLNTSIIGQADDLESFMFGTPRQNLQAVSVTLAEMRSGRCFYCGNPLHGGGDVDHFIPWTRYPRDLAHNFVLAHLDVIATSLTCWPQNHTWIGGWNATNSVVMSLPDACAHRDFSLTRIALGKWRNGLIRRRLHQPELCGFEIRSRSRSPISILLHFCSCKYFRFDLI